MVLFWCFFSSVYHRGGPVSVHLSQDMIHKRTITVYFFFAINLKKKRRFISAFFKPTVVQQLTGISWRPFTTHTHTQKEEKKKDF